MRVGANLLAQLLDRGEVVDPHATGQGAVVGARGRQHVVAARHPSAREELAEGAEADHGDAQGLGAQGGRGTADEGGRAQLGGPCLEGDAVL